MKIWPLNNQIQIKSKERATNKVYEHVQREVWKTVNEKVWRKVYNVVSIQCYRQFTQIEKDIVSK